MELTLATLDNLVSELRATFCPEFRLPQAPSTESGVNYFIIDDFYKAKLSPFFRHWYDLERQTEISVRDGRLSLSLPSLAFLDKLAWLSKLRGDPEFATLMSKIHSRSHFQSGLFEGMMLGIHRARGDELHPLPERPKYKTPDFVLQSASGQEYYIECKSLEDSFAATSHIKNEIKNRLMRFLIKEKITGHIIISFFRIAEGKDIDRVLNAATAELKAHSSGICPATKLDGCLITYEKIIHGIKNSSKSKSITDTKSYERSDQEELRPDITSLPQQQNSNTLAGIEIATNSSAIADFELVAPVFDSKLLHIAEFRVVEIVQEEINNDQQRIKRFIRDAAKQLPINAAGIIYIELPQDNLKFSQNLYDRNFEQIQWQLRNQKPHVAAVVFICRFFDQDGDPTTGSFQNQLYVVPNPDHAAQLHDFKLPLIDPIWPNEELGTPPTNGYISTECGTLFFEFINHHTNAKQLGRTILFSSSDNGQEQIKIWKSFDEKMRVDVINPIFGRHVFCCSWLDYFSSQSFKIGVSWSREGISFATPTAIIKNDFSIP